MGGVRTEEARLDLRSRRFVAAVIGLALSALAGGSASAQTIVAVKNPITIPDFNGDRQADLAVGVPGKRVNAQAHPGAVNVIYAGDDGILDSRDVGGVQEGLAHVRQRSRAPVGEAEVVLGQREPVGLRPVLPHPDAQSLEALGAAVLEGGVGVRVQHRRSPR
jgi:hypothetical protein